MKNCTSPIIAALLVSLFVGCSKHPTPAVWSSSKTNAEIAVINTKDVFLRDGQTNLVRFTTTKSGLMTERHQIFYHDAVLVGEYTERQDSSGFVSETVTEAGTPYSMIFTYLPSKDVGRAFICTKSRAVLDCFNATNGVFYPADAATIREANKLGEDVTMKMPPNTALEPTPTAP